MSEAPKIYVNKPKKAHLKQSKGVEATMASSSSSATVTASKPSSTGGDYGGASKPPEVPKESSFRRFKFLVPLVVTVNIAIGAYLFMRTKKKDVAVEEEPATVVAPTPALAPSTAVATESLHVAQPTRVLEPIPENQQRELFRWMLEEKRKIKTKDPEEKKRIDQEKAILKEFLRAKSIPSI